MAEQSGEKTEAPTPRRREQARKKGEHLVSRELGTALAGAAGALWLSLFGADLVKGARTAFLASLTFDAGVLRVFDPRALVFQLLGNMLWPLAVLGVMAMVGAVIGRAITGGVGFQPDLIAPKGSRLNPVAGLKRMFGSRGLIELIKALAKAMLLIGIAAFLLYRNLPVLAQLSVLPLEAALSQVGRFIIELFFWLTLGLVAIAAVDLPVQLIQWLKRIKMTKQEVRDEFKQQEGSPELKHAMRRFARENLKTANRSAMADATLVLTNPTHFAVALRYMPERDVAPIIVARGRGMTAGVIRDLAAEGRVPVLSYPEVARAIYFTGRVGMTIRPDLYTAVATIIAFAMRVADDVNMAELPHVDVPESARFDADGRMEA